MTLKDDIISAAKSEAQIESQAKTTAGGSYERGRKGGRNGRRDA